MEANRAGAILSYGLRHLGDRLRKACRQDRINYLCQLADTVQQGGLNEAYPQLRRLLGHRRKRPFTPDTLPTLRKVNGELCASPEEVAARWREHFSELEGGHVVSPGDLLASAARGDQLGSWPLPDTISRLPTLTDLQNILLRAGRRKAPGPDRLPAEIGMFTAADMARLLHPLSLKLALRGSEGLGMKSGALVKLYKQKGSREECKAHRGILLLSTLSKTVHQSLRPTLAAHHEAKARPLQLSSRKGMTSLFGAHCVRLFLARRRHKKQPAAVLFTDIESAYYATTRGLAMRRPGADPVSAVTLSGETNEGRRQELHDLLTGGTALADEGLHPWAEAVAAEIHDTTWMTICGDRVPLQTHRGTRPGSAYADLIFAAVVRKVLAYRDQEREQHPHCAPVAHVDWDGSFSLGPRQHPCHRELLDDVVWADDISRCIAPATSSQLRRATVAEAGLLSTAFQAHGFQLSYGVSKSAALLCPAGPGARQVRRSLFGGDACARILHEHTGGVCLPFVDRYRHLGVIQTHGTGILAELKQRCGSAWGCFRDCRKQVFRSPRLSIERKAAVFHSLIMPRLLYGAGSWPVLSKGEWRLFSSTLTSMCRQLLGLKHTDDQPLAASTIYALARQPAPFVWLFLERLRYLRALVTHGPRPLWALIRNDDGYLEAMRQALAWLFERVRATSSMPCPSSQWDCWVSLMTQQPGRFKSMLRQAKDLEILRASCLGALFELRKQLQACCDQETVFHVKSVFPIDALGRGTLPVSMDTDVSRGFLPGNGHGLVVAGVTAPPIAFRFDADEYER